MSILSERIWFGSVYRGDEAPVDLRRPLAIAVTFILLVIFRLLLPFRSHPSMLVYEEVVWGLMNQDNWARQALVAAIEYPPVPTIALLLLRTLQRPFVAMGMGGASLVTVPTLMVAICQVWSFFYLVRLADLYHSRKLRYPLAALLMLCLFLGSGALDANPFWVYVVMLCSIVFHLCRWEISDSLRDLVVVALNCGLLMFGGPIGMLFSLIIALTLGLRGSRTLLRRQGGAMLLWMPILYSLLLYPLFNWLVMGNAFFWLKRFFSSFEHRGLLANLADAPTSDLHLLLAITVLALLIMLLPRVPLYTRLGINLAWACGLIAVVRSGSNIYIGGEYLLTSFTIIPLLLFFLYYEDSPVRRVLPTLALMGIIVLAVAACIQFRGTSRYNETFASNPPPPPPQEILDVVNSVWSRRGRVLIYDLHSAALYVRPRDGDSDSDRRRFLARLDYDARQLRRELATTDEVFHLLIPPDNNRFYSRGRSPLADIQQGGQSGWLMLEKKWPGGWQLFRCVIAQAKPSPATSTP